MSSVRGCFVWDHSMEKNFLRGLTKGSGSAIISWYNKEGRLLFSPAGSARVRSIPENRVFARIFCVLSADEGLSALFIIYSGSVGFSGGAQQVLEVLEH